MVGLFLSLQSVSFLPFEPKSSLKVNKKKIKSKLRSFSSTIACFLFLFQPSTEDIFLFLTLSFARCLCTEAFGIRCCPYPLCDFFLRHFDFLSLLISCSPSEGNVAMIPSTLVT